MNKRYLYLVGFAVALSGKVLAMEQNEVEPHLLGQSDIASRYQKLIGTYDLNLIELNQIDGAQNLVNLIEKQRSNAKETFVFYGLPLDEMASTFNKLLNPCFGIENNQYYGNYQNQQAKALVNFLDGKTTDGIVRIWFKGMESMPGNLHEQAKNLWQDIASQLVSSMPSLTNSMLQATSLDDKVNIVMLPALLRTGNTAKRLYVETQKQVDIRSVILNDLLSMAGSLEEKKRQANAIVEASKELSLLAPLVENFEKVIQALKAAGRMS